MKEVNKLLDAHEARLRSILEALKNKITVMPDGTLANEHLSKVINQVSVLRRLINHSPTSKPVQVVKSDEKLLKMIDDAQKFIADLKKRAKATHDKNVVLEEALRVRKINLTKAAQDYDFLTRRVKQVYGHKGFIDLMNHIECPGGFDANRYRNKNEVKQ